jgi:hypothetical protein
LSRVSLTPKPYQRSPPDLTRYAHVRPDRDDSTRAAVTAILDQRLREQQRSKITNG